MRTLICFVLSSALLLTGRAVASAAVIADAVADYRPGQAAGDLGVNIPASVYGGWSYLEASSAPAGATGVLGWDSTIGRYERVGAPHSNGALDFPTVGLESGALRFDPFNFDPEFAVVRWNSGTYSGPLRIQGTYQKPTNSGNGVSFQVFVNFASVFQDNLSANANNLRNFDIVTNVQANQLVDFLVGQDGGTNFIGDTVFMTVQIVPEPSSLVLAMLGLACGLAKLRHRVGKSACRI